MTGYIFFLKAGGRVRAPAPCGLGPGTALN